MHKSRIHPSNLSKTKGIWENGAESTNVVILGYSLISVAALRIYIDSPLSKKTKNEETSSAQLKIGSEQAGEEWFNRLRLSLKFPISLPVQLGSLYETLNLSPCSTNQ